ELGFGRREACLHRARVHEQSLARFRQRQRLRHARTVDELRPDDALERGGLLADGRLRVPKTPPCAVERRFFSEGMQRSKMADRDTVPSGPAGAVGHLCSLSCAATSRRDIWPDIPRTLIARFS